MAKDGNTYAKRQRETLKRQKAEAKRDRRKSARTCRDPPPELTIRRGNCGGSGRRSGKSLVAATSGCRRPSISDSILQTGELRMIAFQTAPRIPADLDLPPAIDSPPCGPVFVKEGSSIRGQRQLPVQRPGSSSQGPLVGYGACLVGQQDFSRLGDVRSRISISRGSWPRPPGRPRTSSNFS